MATLSDAAKNAALSALATLLETGSSFARPAWRSVDSGGNQIHFTFFGQTAPLADTFSAPSGGVMNKADLPWSMPITTTLTRTLSVWQLRSQANVTEITGTYGATGSGADIELTTAELTVLFGNSLRFVTFSLSIA